MKRSVTDLKASAPRTFDKELIDLLVVIQHGGQPIQVEEPPREIVREVHHTETRTELPQDVLDELARLKALTDQQSALIKDLIEHVRMVAARIIEVEDFAHNHRHWARGSKLPMLFGRVENGRLVAIDADDGQPREEAA